MGNDPRSEDGVWNSCPCPHQCIKISAYFEDLHDSKITEGTLLYVPEVINDTGWIWGGSEMWDWG